MNAARTSNTLLYRAFRAVVKPFIGKGIGRFKPIGAAYRYLAGALIPEQAHLVTVNNYKMWVQTEKHKGIDGIAQQLLFEGTYESYTTSVFKEIVGKGMNVVDIGANIGYYTLLAASLIGKSGKVFAFEPEPRNYASLLKNIETNHYKNIVPLQKAVSNQTGNVQFFLDKAESGAHSLYQVRNTAKESITVDTISLDSYFQETELPIHVIKIDVEGAEMTVLSGMTRILDKNASLKLFTEFWPTGLLGSGSSPQQYWDKLVESGFKFIYLVNEEKQRLEPADLAYMTRFCKNTLLRQPTSVNLLCSRTSLKVGVL